jgi:broad specificity phosphatase PhoE
MAVRIVLVRHGPSAHVHAGGAIDRAGIQAWHIAYDVAGIQAVSQPPREVIDIAAAAGHVVASALPRAVASAERLAPGRRIETSPLLRETPLDIPAWPTRLPLGAWAMLISLGWSYRIVRGVDASADELARAAAAAEWLAGLTADGSTAVAVTHGAFRRLVAKHLLTRGWVCTSRRGGYRPWSAWGFAGPRGLEAPDRPAQPCTPPARG